VARLLLTANAIGRIAGRGARNSRVLKSGYAAAGNALRSLKRVLHLLFLQAAGLIFCLFAVAIVAELPRVYREQVAQKHGPGRLYLLAVLAFMFLWFGLTSFWRSRRK
jgi:hypothetical protein